MRIFLIFVALFAGLVAGLATAGVPERLSVAAPESNAVHAVRNLINRCIPGIRSGNAMPASGLTRVAATEEATILGGRRGRVWLDGQERLLFIDFEDAPVCRVVALSVDPAVLADLVLRVFAEADGVFRRERLRLDRDGIFSAVFSTHSGNVPLVIRITTTRQDNGNIFAALTVERRIPEPS